MPFDSTRPPDHATIEADELRNQFNALNDKIDAVPAGPPGADGTNGTNGTDGATGAPGAPGAQGPPFASAVVDAVNTLPPASDATVTTSFDGNNVRFTFGLPRGADGINLKT